VVTIVVGETPYLVDAGPGVVRRYHTTFHTSAHDLAAVVSRAKPGLLVLYHQLFHRVSEQTLLDEIRQRYDGPVVSGRDLDVY
jgi:ribonuclease BN (tRNA processing enzyme)